MKQLQQQVAQSNATKSKKMRGVVADVRAESFLSEIASHDLLVAIFSRPSHAGAGSELNGHFRAEDVTLGHFRDLAKQDTRTQFVHVVSAVFYEQQ